MMGVMRGLTERCVTETGHSGMLKLLLQRQSEWLQYKAVLVLCCCGTDCLQAGSRANRKKDKKEKKKKSV